MGFPFVLRVKNGRAAHDLTSPLTLATDLTILGEYPLFQLLEPGPMIAVTAKMPLVGALALSVSLRSKTTAMQRKATLYLLGGLGFLDCCLDRGDGVRAKMFGDLEKHFRFSGIARDEYRVGFGLYGIF